MEDVLFQIMLEMATVMMRTTMLAAILMVVTVVAQISIQIYALYVNVLLMKDQVEDMEQQPHF